MVQPDISVKWLELEIVASGDTNNSRFFFKKGFDIIEILNKVRSLNSYDVTMLNYKSL